MPLRLMQVFIAREDCEFALELLAKHELPGIWKIPVSEEQAIIQVLLPSEQTELISDLITQHLASSQGFRMVLMSVEATLPQYEPPETPEQEPNPAKSAPIFERISREELYADIAGDVKLSPVFIVTVILSALVAAIGLMRGDVAIIIGAMVIAPLLTPNVALSLASALGDLSLAGRSLRVNATGLAVALSLSFLIGLIFTIDPGIPAILSRTRLSLGDIVLALASGSAGALAFTSGVPAALTGVMVAVALLPPLVTAGMLAGSGHFRLAIGAFLLYFMNVACVNLAGVVTFVSQGIRPRTFWKQDKAQKATRIAIIAWLSLLLVFVIIIIWFFQN